MGENTGRARAGTTVEWTGGGDDAALQPPCLLLPPSPPYPDTIMHPPELPCPSHPFPLLRHRAVWDATVRENTWRGRVEGHGQVAWGGNSAALQLPRLLLTSPLPPPHEQGFTSGIALPTTDHTPHSPRATLLPPPLPLPPQRDGTLQWGRTRGGYGKGVGWEIGVTGILNAGTNPGRITTHPRSC